MNKHVIMCVIIAALAVSCGRQGTFPPVGSYSEVVVVTETGKVEGLTEDLVRVLQHPVDYYTKEELQFRVMVISAEELQRKAPSKNLVLFGVAKQGAMGNLIESFIGTSAVRTVLEGKNSIFKKLNYPVNGQLTLIITASNGDRLAKTVRENASLIRDIIEEANRERLRAYLLAREKVEVGEEIRGKYGFTIRVPFLYDLNQERSDVPGVEIVRVKPHRGITVSWRSWEKNSLSVADSAALYDVRADIAWKMYNKDVMRRDIVFFHDDRLGPYEAVRMDGYWEKSEDLYGGPFMCFFIYDRLKLRLWIIDCLVYAPGFDKHTLLRELRAVAETFRI
jgi:hypothetical protein